MENQLESANSLTGGQDGKPQVYQNVPWREIFEAGKDVGAFYIASGSSLLYLNPALRDWLGIEGSQAAGEKGIREAFAFLAEDPDLLPESFQNLPGSAGGPAQIQFQLREDSQATCCIQFFSYPGTGSRPSGYGGLVSIDRGTRRQVGQLAQVFNKLLAPARQLAAAVNSNLQALRGNLQSWSPNVLEDFLEDASLEASRLRHLLDLGLSYGNLIQEKPQINQPVRLRELLDAIIKEQGYSGISISEELSGEDQPLFGQVDQGMIKVALTSILKEFEERNPSGQRTEVRISGDDGFITLKLESPRMLPLPGMEGDEKEERGFEFNPELYLAQEILAAQGGKLIVEQGLASAGGGLGLEVVLPAAGTAQNAPIRQEWIGLLERGSARILLAEAQPEYQLRIREALTDLGYRVDLAVEGGTVLDLVQTRQPDLVVLARNLPGMDGLLVTQGIRRWSPVPILMISVRDSMEDLLYAYRLGVDEYLKKPFLVEELLAKVQVFLSRQGSPRGAAAAQIYQEGSIRIDHGTRQVWVRGDPVQLTPIEYNLLVYLSRQGRQIIPYEQLLEHVWEGPEKGTRQGLFVHVRRLREKIEADPENPQILGNKWGVGYVFNP